MTEIGRGARGDESGELAAPLRVGGDDTVHANAESVRRDGDMLRGLVHVDDAAGPVKQDGCGCAGIEHSFCVAGAVLSDAECVTNPEGILQVRHGPRHRLMISSVRVETDRTRQVVYSIPLEEARSR